MTTFCLTHDALTSLASMHQATPQGKDDREMTPILTGIKLTVTPERWTAVATDRYIAVEVSAPMGDYVHTLEAEGVTIVVDSVHFVDVAKRSKGEPWITVTTDGELVTFQRADGSALLEVSQLSGNYPWIDRLLYADGAEPAAQPSTLLDPTKLARLGKVVPPSFARLKASERNGEPLALTFHGELSAVEVTRAGRIGADETWRAIFLPNRPVAR